MLRPGVRRLFRLPVRRADVVARDVSAEIDTHIALRTEQLVARGFPPDAARAEAVRRFGAHALDPHTLTDAARRRDTRMRIGEFLGGVVQDAVYAVRGLRREPLLTTFIIITFALGIGANAAMFGVVDRLLIRGPEHVRDPGRVVRLYMTVQPPGMRAVNTGSFGYITYDVMRKNAKSFEAVAAYSVHEKNLAFGNGQDAELISFGESTADFFPLLGVHPLVGRFYTSAEDSTSAPQRVVVLGYGLWRRAFAGDSGVLGKTVMLGFAPYTVIGVAPKGFTGPEMFRVDAWIPLSIRSRNVTDDWTHSWSAQWHQVIARLKPGVTFPAVTADITAAHQHAYTDDDPAVAHATMQAAPIRFSVDGSEPAEMAVTRWLIGVSAVMLLIGCANVVNLLLARAVRRRREVAVRLALGVGRARLMRMLLTESLVLAMAGWTAGLVFAYGSGTLIRSVLLPNVEWSSSPVAGRVLLGSLAMSLVVGIVVGLIPALQSASADLSSALKAGARDGGGRTSRLRAALTIAQSALSVLLLVGAGLFVRSLQRVDSLDLGLQPDRVVLVDIRRPSVAGIPDSAAQRLEIVRRTDFYPQAVARIRALPDVEAASLSVGLPFQSSFSQRLRVPGWDSLPRLAGGSPSIAAVGDDYFKTVGQRILRGRAFTAADRRGSEPVTLLNATMAATLWPGRDPIGECIRTGNGAHVETLPCARIVGIVADAHRFGLREPARMQYYVPFGQETGMGGTKLIVRPRGRADVAIAEVQRELRALDPTIGTLNFNLLQESIDPQIRPWRLGATMFTLMGVLALVVAAVGLYSVMAYLVVQRTHEIGIRSALGASGLDIVSLVVRSGVSLAAAGIAIGLVASLALGQFISPLLFDTSPRDGLVLGMVACSLLGVSLLASAIPAIRARRVSPLQALRAE